MQTQHKLTYLVKTPLIAEFIDQTKLKMPQLSIRESYISRTIQLSKGDIFLLDIRHSNDIRVLKATRQNQVNTIVFISNYAYLRQVLMEQTSPIIFPDFTDEELKNALHKAFAHVLSEKDIEDIGTEYPFSTFIKDMALTDREIQLLITLSKGFLYKEIAQKMGISLGTVKQHCHKIYNKLNVTNRTEAINKLEVKSLSKMASLQV